MKIFFKIMREYFLYWHCRHFYATNDWKKWIQFFSSSLWCCKLYL